MDTELLTFDERITFELRALYRGAGYVPFRMKKFEEYEFYIQNKEFLASDQVVTFTDTDGRLMALKPDVTLSVIKSGEDTPGQIQRVYYNENVYRVSDSTGRFKEIMQTGLECIGDLTFEDVFEVLALAGESLAKISPAYMLEISHLGVLKAVLESVSASGTFCMKAQELVAKKAVHELRELCAKYGAEAGFDRLACLAESFNNLEAVIALLGEIGTDEAREVSREIRGLNKRLQNSPYASHVAFDFSLVSDMNYYNGFTFTGFVNGLSKGILAGGQYDKMMRKMKRNAKAIGFAVYLDRLEESAETTEDEMAGDEGSLIRIALPKGRLGEQVYRMFAQAGFDCPEILDESRKLIFRNERAGISLFWVKPSDVSEYVERGAADIGVAGKDILLENRPDVYELMDLGCGKCRMMVAGKKDFVDDGSKTLRVATKFVNITLDYYGSVGRDIDIIKLNGSIELAPIVGLSDVIVDIVETGSTLRENNLEIKAEIIPLSARLIANKASYNFKHNQIETIVSRMKEQVKNHD